MNRDLLRAALDNLVVPAERRWLDDVLDVAADARELGQDVAPILAQAGLDRAWIDVLRPRAAAQPLLESKRQRLIRELRASLHEKMERAKQTGAIGMVSPRAGDRYGEATITRVRYENGSWDVDVAVDHDTDSDDFDRVVMTTREDGTVDVVFTAAIHQLAYTFAVD